jgi:hypothetical protein
VRRPVLAGRLTQALNHGTPIEEEERVSRRRLSYFLHPSHTSAPSDDGVAGPTGSVAGIGSGISRRVFLVRSSLVAGTAAVVGSVPGLTSIVSSAEADSPEIGGAAPEAAGAAEAGAGAELTQPLVVHVVNAGTGELNLYQGTNQVVARSPELAQAIVRLAASKS